MQEFLERVAQTRCKVDRERSIVPDVKALGLVSRNLRIYTPAAARKAKPLYQNLPVFLNHATTEERDVGDRFGTLKNVRFVEHEGLVGDLHFNPKHPLAEAVCWAAENDPSLYGLSHKAYGHGRQEGDRYVVEEIVSVRSVDLVADPATTRGLFESLGRSCVDRLLGERIDACRQRMASLCNGLPRSADHFAQRLVESNGPAFPGETR